MNKTILSLVGVLTLGSGVIAIAQRGAADASKASAPRGTWTPPEEDPAAYRDIVDYNIFRADRSEIASKVDRERNPPEPEETRPPKETRIEVPADPDASWLLVGLSHDKDGAIAYIENAKSGDLLRLNGVSDFSKGKVTSIGYDAIVYQIEDQQRVIRVGQNFVGSKAQHADGTSPGSSGSSGKPSKNASLQDRLKALKEQRALEFGGGEAKPATPGEAESPAPEPAPAQPVDSDGENSDASALDELGLEDEDQNPREQ